MKQNVRVHSDTNIVHAATVEVRGPQDADGNDTWLDISHMVNGIEWTPTVGEVSWVTLRLVPSTMTFKGILADETLAALAEHLRARGYDVRSPVETAA
jgi:hypothetical protein